MYAWSNDNETDSESSLPDLDLYEISDTTPKNISAAMTSENVHSAAATATSGLQLTEEQNSTVDGVFQRNAVRSVPVKPSDREGGSDLVELLKGDLLRPAFAVPTSSFSRTATPSLVAAAVDSASSAAPSVTKENEEVNATTNRGSAAAKPSLADTPLPSSPSSSTASPAAFTSAFADSSLAKEIAAALAAPSSGSRSMGGRIIAAASADMELKRLFDKVRQL